MNSKFTDEQFEWTQIFWGMLGEGCSTDEALTYIMLMKCPTEIYSWLLKEVKSYKEAGIPQRVKSQKNVIL
jgi:hypothetical protein